MDSLEEQEEAWQPNTHFMGIVPHQMPSRIITGGGRRLRRIKEDDDEN
jgi:hypothetical protein